MFLIFFICINLFIITFVSTNNKKMKNKLFLPVLALFFVFNNAYSQKTFWTKSNLDKLNSLEKFDRLTMPSKYQIFSLKFDEFNAALQNAPNDLTSQYSDVVVSFPNAEGILMNYNIYSSPIMEEGLAEKFPDIKTYVAKGIDDPTAIMRLSITQFGLHTMTLSGNTGATYIDTHTTDLKNYIVYNKSDLVNDATFECGFDELNHDAFKIISKDVDYTRASDGNFRVYRLAMACTGEYAQFHGGTVAAAQAAIVVTVNRVNTIYERDFSARLNLVANNDLLIYTDGATDPYTNNSGTAMLRENQTNVTSQIGSANYDIGHVVSTNGGGVAGLGVFCNNTQKARGVTGTNSPVGDPFDVDYVAHEIGHQFGCNHTFNGDAGSCGGGNRNNSTAVEPGSGSTIMAYAGICSPQNVQQRSDAHFSFISIAEANTRTLLGTSCANVTANNNSAPVVNAGPDYTIPKGTAFVLKGTATDANNDALTYCWEQTDTQISTQPPTELATGGPNYRSRTPSTSSDRFMPVLSSVVAGNLTPTWEVTPNTARTMNFALTVRDNRMPNGGQTGRDNTIITVNGVAGPFTVTSQNTTGISYTGLSNQMFTWNVAGTTTNGVNTANVKITLSTDNGLTFPIVLAASTLNDGSESVQIPNGINSTNCRVKIEAVDNLFYSVNSTRFTITNSLSSNSFDFDNFSLFPNPNKGNFSLSFTSDNSSDIVIDIHDISGRKVYNNKFSNTGTFNQNINLNKVQSGIYLVSITNGDKKSIKRIIVQ